MPPRCGVQVGGGGAGGGRAGSGRDSGSSQRGGEEGSEGWEWSWEGLKGAASQGWEQWKEQPRRWADAAGSAGQEWHAAARRAGREVRGWFSWQTLEGWQERHWASFEARQRAQLEALTEEQRQRWEELQREGGEMWRREIAAFEQWQQRVYAAQHPEVKAQAQPTCPNFRLSFLMLPLLPNIGEALRQFGLRMKAGRAAGRAQGRSVLYFETLHHPLHTP